MKQVSRTSDFLGDSQGLYRSVSFYFYYLVFLTALFEEEENKKKAVFTHFGLAAT